MRETMIDSPDDRLHAETEAKTVGRRLSRGATWAARSSDDAVGSAASHGVSIVSSKLFPSILT